MFVCQPDQWRGMGFENCDFHISESAFCLVTTRGFYEARNVMGWLSIGYPCVYMAVNRTTKIVSFVFVVLLDYLL